MTYHNSGHHRDVATPRDLTTAKKGQSFYSFALQSQIGGYFKTWKLESEILKKKGKSQWLNRMILYTIIPWTLIGLIIYIFGWYVALLYFAASVFGISILESQNYFSHYGLKENKNRWVLRKSKSKTFLEFRPHSWKNNTF